MENPIWHAPTTPRQSACSPHSVHLPDLDVRIHGFDVQIPGLDVQIHSFDVQIPIWTSKSWIWKPKSLIWMSKSQIRTSKSWIWTLPAKGVTRRERGHPKHSLQLISLIFLTMQVIGSGLQGLGTPCDAWRMMFDADRDKVIMPAHLQAELISKITCTIWIPYSRIVM